MEENMDDRISQLPECIVHHILSFLNSPAQLLRISVLSKTWFSLTASFPILDFNFVKIIEASSVFGSHMADSIDRRYAKDKFFEYVAYTMSRFCEQNVRAHRFNLLVDIVDRRDAYNVDRWIKLIVEKDVQVLDICTPVSSNCRWMYRLPYTLLPAPSLTSLTMCGCLLPDSLNIPLEGVKFMSLKKLSLFDLKIDQKVINNLTHSCPLLQDFNAHYCYGFNRFCVYGLQNLEKVQIYNRWRLEKIDIEAPNLMFLSLADSTEGGEPCVNLSFCKKLKTLCFCGGSSSISKWFAEFLFNFPLLENLFLNIPSQCNNLKVSSHSLRKFVLHPRCDLEEIEIDAPNLLLFQYSSDLHPVPFSLPSTSTELKSRIECYIESYAIDHHDTLWFQRLMRFLDKKNGFKVLKLHMEISTHKLKVLRSSAVELEEVELIVDPMQGVLAHLAVVQAVLWCCCPRSLTLRSYHLLTSFEEWRWRLAVQFTYEKLLQQEDQGHTNIVIVLSSKFNPTKRFHDLNSLLKALPRYLDNRILTFIKEGVVQEAR